MRHNNDFFFSSLSIFCAKTLKICVPSDHLFEEFLRAAVHLDDRAFLCSLWLQTLCFSSVTTRKSLIFHIHVIYLYYIIMLHFSIQVHLFHTSFVDW